MKENKRNKRLKKLIIFCFIILIVIIALYSIIKTNYRKSHNIAESNHTTAEDDRKLVKYTDFTLLQNLKDTKLEYTKLFKEFNLFIVKDLAKIKDGDGSDDFYNNNSDIFWKDSYTIEYKEYQKIYKKIKSKKIDFSNDYKSCEFKSSGENAIEFNIIYENNFVIKGILIKTDSVKIVFN